MKNTRFTPLILCCLLGICNVHAADIGVPAAFESISSAAPEAYDFVKNCGTTLSEDSFRNTVRDADADPKRTVTTRPADPGKSYFSVSGGKIFCIRMSDRRYPIVPLAVFERTIDFPSMEKEELLRLRSDLSRQLASFGYAIATVVNDNGNANQVAYMFASERPIKVYYHTNFLKKGEYSESDVGTIYHNRGAGTMSSVLRGDQAEYVRYFLSR